MKLTRAGFKIEAGGAHGFGVERDAFDPMLVVQQAEPGYAGLAHFALAIVEDSNQDRHDILSIQGALKIHRESEADTCATITLMPATTEPGVFDEQELVARAREGDAAAYNELVGRYERKIFRLAKHITQNDEDAEDVLQETFMKAFEHLPDFQGQSKFYTWIVRIAVNESLMKLRKRKSDRTVPLDEPVDTGEDTVVREIAVWEENPEQRYSREEMGQILDDAVQSLKPAFRTVFALRDIEELSTEETAEALGISVPAVKSRLLRARLQLREKLTRFFKRKGDDIFAYL
jgi:RNA polymerase sigma-70 factor (ECF subfamily)